MEVWNHFLLLPVLVMLERLGVLVPEVVVDHCVQPGRVKVHVLLRVLLVWHLRAWCLKSLVYCNALDQNWSLSQIVMAIGVSAKSRDTQQLQ